ncbi:hypothetical protein Ddye_008986, partial [Dipteronia dyeriana]
MPINILCFEFFTTGWLKDAYIMNVNSVLKPEIWDIPYTVHDRIVLSWEKKKPSGRLKKSRIPSVGEKRKLQACLNYGQKGHNKRSCLKPSATTSKPAKKIRSCSICKKEGHNRLKCPDRPFELNLNDTEKAVIHTSEEPILD